MSLYADQSPYPGTDVVDNDEPLLVFELDQQCLTDAYGSWYARPVYIELMAAMKAMVSSSDEAVRSQSFTIWVGDSGPHFCAAIPDHTPGQTQRIIEASTQLHKST